MTDRVTGDGAGWPSLISALNPSEEADLVGRLGGRDILLPKNEYRQYPLRGHLWQAGPQARGRVLVLPGFTEFCEKYALFARRLVGAGYDCLIIDWPGQGWSGQLGAHQLVVHLDHFSAYFSALDELLAAAGWQKEKLFFLPTCCCKKFVQCREISREMIKMNNQLMCTKLTRPPLSWPINYQTIISCTNETACKQSIFFTKLCKPRQNKNPSPGLWSCLPEMTT